MGLPRWEVAGNEMGRQIFHMTCDFQDAVPSFERDDKQRDDKFRKTERNGVNHGGTTVGSYLVTIWQLCSSYLAAIEQEVTFLLISSLSNILNAMQIEYCGNFHPDLERSPLDPPG